MVPCIDGGGLGNFWTANQSDKRIAHVKEGFHSPISPCVNHRKSESIGQACRDLGMPSNHSTPASHNRRALAVPDGWTAAREWEPYHKRMLTHMGCP